ncbi:hypothetical protein HYH03_009468 [Edaphochlamys debaryana]|uniref:ACB domain-containing protein n=1 Tax=Edaphochlamys debaryana TaxID=47281 RepID=A0A836BYE6_9CHLO|nr:hypothetical protein HYH03_009468 [Edaphochlamys debaryana]|eukprot:KAG2492223.1 hypothetical protein HYH03_009468 [Edaphochlamys debaryana]
MDDVLEGVATDEEDIFNTAASFLASAVTTKDARFTDKLKLQFYGLYKQATAGKCSGGRPAFWDVAGRAKWDAWQALGDLSKEHAMQRYAQLLGEVAPEWNQGGSRDTQAKRGGTMGPVFSSLAAAEEDEDAEGPETLHEVAGQGDAEAVGRMLEAGTPVDERDEQGCTALHFAADRGSEEVARLLLGAGADVNAVDEDGQTPLHYAAVTAHREVYDLLVAAGADISIQDSQGQTAAEAAPEAWGLKGA